MTSSRNYIKLDEKVNAIHSIPPRAKILHGEICALSQNDGYCFASNKYFAKQLNLSIQSVSRLIGILKRYDLIAVTRTTDDNGYRKRIIKPNSSIVLSKISVGNAQKREKPTLKNANHNIVSKRPGKSGMTYRIQVKIKDKGSGEIKVHSTTWKPPVGLTPKQMEREVVIFASEYENAIKTLETASGEPTQSAETTFSDYALWWLNRRKDEVSASYFVNCENAIELTKKHIGGYKLKELTPNIIQQYYDKLDRMEKTVTVVTAKPALRERMNQTGIGYMKLRYEKNFSSCSLANALAGKQISYEYAKRLAETLGEKTETLFNVTHTTQKYAYETISKIKRTIRAILATAKKQRLIADNYASADYISFPKRPPREIDYMDDEDAKKFYKAANEYSDIRYKTAMLTLLLTGMRRGELCGLEWSDIDFENATITIARSLTTVQRVGLVLKEPKTESSKRVIAISDKLLSVLTEYKAWYEEYKAMHGDKWENSNRLFIGEYGGNIYPGTINMWMKKICQSAGLEERTVHSLRHTNITMQIAAGVPIVTVAGRAGHARTSTTTDIYSHFLKTADRTAAQKIEEIFD